MTEENIPFTGEHSINRLLLASNDLPKIELTEEELGYVIEFLHSLTDLKAIKFKDLIPLSVPSGISLDD